MLEDFSKGVTKDLNDGSVGELSPGQTGRRYEPEEGVANLNRRIHRESDYVDKYKNLPFTFSKPKKLKKTMVKVCKNCKYPVGVNKDTVGIICSKCHTYSQVEDIYIEKE
jgi:hypothetical protein